MNIREALKGQYHASMAMLKQVIESCPDALWGGGNHPAPFWRVVYHTLFFTHLYLQPNEKAFRPWERHWDQAQFLGPLPWPPHDKPKTGEPHTKAQMLAYWGFCDAMIDGAVDRMDLDDPECGFPWYRLPKLDHQINNIRHIQHHAALLSGRLRLACGMDIPWVGSNLL